MANLIQIVKYQTKKLKNLANKNFNGFYMGTIVNSDLC